MKLVGLWCWLAIFAASALGADFTATMVGHEYRQDDLPSIARAPDGSVWVAWLSFAGDRDDIAIRHYSDGKWSNIHWVPNTSRTWKAFYAAVRRS